MKIFYESFSNLRFADIFLRVISILLSISTVCLIVTNKQNDDSSIYGGKLLFTNLIGLKYMVCISAICVGYGCLAAVCCLWVRCLITTHLIARIFYVSDQMMAYLMVTSAASVMELIYLAYNGDQNVIWSEVCSIYDIFCKRLKLAMSLHVVSLCCFCLLAMISAYRLFSRFDPPFVPPDQRTDIEPK